VRTPNAKCIICEKPLYRRPNELARVRHVACIEHRGQAQKKTGLTKAQQAALAIGRKPGTNHRTGYKHREESKRKASASHKAWCKANPDRLKTRGDKTRGENHYNWKGGSSRLNVAIRRLTENRKWMDAVKARDGKCLSCGSVEELESHHIIPLAVLINTYGITNREQARNCKELWDLKNGMTVCARCHYKTHGRKYED
jgi:5-methylcytosine-specific restriction endonuclease McrA